MAGRSFDGVGLIGAGAINLAVLEFLVAVNPDLRAATIFDIDPQRAADFVTRAEQFLPAVDRAGRIDQALARHPLVSLATTAGEPYVDLASCQKNAVVLHISLRDIAPVSIRNAVNVVDDAHHVCRERTSLHLAEMQAGDRSFIHADFGGLLNGSERLPPDDGRLVIFSPFGLGALDIALAEFILAQAKCRGSGIEIPDFLPNQPVSATTH
jgi:ornithine cyclodeaminase